jgi:hypothetical protein
MMEEQFLYHQIIQTSISTMIILKFNNLIIFMWIIQLIITLVLLG